MSAFDELATRCEQRGWRLAITGDAHEPDGSVVTLNRPAIIVAGLEVRGVKAAAERELLHLAQQESDLLATGSDTIESTPRLDPHFGLRLTR